MDKTKRIPYYEQCASLVLKAVRAGKYKAGEFLPPERDLSREFGVNRLTLRKGLAELVRQGVLEPVPGAGNRVLGKGSDARKLRLIACVMNRRPGVRTLSPYYADLFSGIEAALAEVGYSLVFSSVAWGDLWTEAGAVRIKPQIVNLDCDGALLIGGLPDELGVLYRKRGVAVAFLDHAGPKGFSSIIPDNAVGAYNVARYLVGLGHRRISFLGAREDPVVDARLGGLVRALNEAGRSFMSKDFIRGDYEIRPAYEAMKAYLSGNRRKLPTAVMAVNDEAAIGALKAIRECGLQVPQDVSVTGFDDIAWAAHTEPPLTTVRVPREELGRAAVRALMMQLDGARVPAAVTVLGTELVVRESCIPPRR